MWEKATIEDTCDILDKLRKPITKSKRIEGPYPYYGATGVLSYVEGYLFDEPLVLVGEDGAKWDVGDKTAFAIDGKVWVNNHAHVLRPKRDKLLDNWLIYFIEAIDLAPYITGLTVPKLNQAKLKTINFPLPPLDEQKRIVAILDEAFAGIDQAIANTKKNIQNAKELFESYLNNIFTQKGEGWSERKLVDVCTLQRGFDLPKRLRIAGSYPLISSSGVIDSHIEAKVARPCVATGRSGSIGNVFYIQN
jgi:type I restriction enzyme, S subunit